MSKYDVANAINSVMLNTKTGLSNSINAGMEKVLHDVNILRNNGKEAAISVRDKASAVVDSVSGMSVNSMLMSGKQNLQKTTNYMGSTTFGQMGKDLQGAIVNSNPYQKAQQGADWARGKGSTLLSDLDKFYHTADGSYDRTKVGLTAAAGLGIAGIAGYNMNN